MDYSQDHSFHARRPSQQHVHYPPSSYQMSTRSTTVNSSSDSFVKRPLSASDESLPEPVTAPGNQQGDSKRRWIDNLFPSSVPIRLFLATVLLETIIDLAIQADIFSRLGSVLQPGEQSGQDPTQRVALYLGIFAFAHVFQLVIAIEAVWSQNTLQFLFLTIFNLLFFIYSLIQAREIRKLALAPGVTSIPVNVLTILAHVTIGLSEVAFIALGWKIWKEFGWKVYKFLGADRQIKRIYAHYQIFLCLLRFDLFFGVGFSAQLIFFVLGKGDVEYFLTIAALPLSCLLLIEGHVAARYENKWLMGTFMLGVVAATVYFAYKLLRIWQAVDTTFQHVYESLTLFASVSLFFLITTFVWGCLVFNNFGRGLKEQMSKSQPQTIRRRGTTATMHSKRHYPMISNPNRMSIE